MLRIPAVAAHLAAGVKIVQRHKAARQFVVIGRDGFGQGSQGRISVAALQVAEHLVVAAVFLDDVDHVVNLAAQELHHLLVLGADRVEMIVLRHLLRQACQVLFRWRRQRQKACPAALENK